MQKYMIYYITHFYAAVLNFFSLKTLKSMALIPL